jgi:hypothetical protein
MHDDTWYDAATNKELCDYILRSVDCLYRQYPGAGFFVVGDFDSLNTNIFNKHLCFKQIVLHSTRGNNIISMEKDKTGQSG